MNKKLMITAAALLAFTSLVGCNVKTGGNTGSSGDNTSGSSVEPDTKCTVTFDLNYDGAPAPTTVQVEKDDYVDEPDDPTRDNYFFKGWYDTANASGYEFDFLLTPITEDITLYADWAAAYNVKFYLNKPEATEQEVYSSAVVEAGELVSRPADPKIKGFTFGGWYTSAACADGEEFNFALGVSSNLDLFAKWDLPDWSSVKAAIDKYLGFLSSVEGVTVPQFPNSDYTVDDIYRDALVITAPDKCAAEYLDILETAGYTVDREKNEASNTYITLKLREKDDATGDQFELLVIINGTGEADTFNPIPYQVGTQQNYLGLPTTALSLFSKFEVYKGNLTTGDPCASVSLFFDAKPEGSTLTDEAYFNQKLNAFKSKLGSKYSSGYFTDTGGMYFYDKAYLTMNQVDAFDASTPLKIEILSYSYAALYGAGVSLNKIDQNTFAAASATALWKTTAAFEVDLSAIAAASAVNGKNFIVEYDVGTRTEYVEVDVFGIKKANAAVNSVYNTVLTAVSKLSDWGLFQDADKNYYAYHYVKDEHDAVKADAKMTFTVQSDSVLNGYCFQIVLNPVDTEWNAQFVADYFAKQALPGDETALPAYTGTFAFIEMETSQYGDYLDIYMKYTDAAEAQAYLASLTNATYNYSAKGQDADTGAYIFASQSTNFEVQVYVGQDSLEIVVNAAPEKEIDYDGNALATINATLKPRHDFEMPAEAVALLTATYTKINYYSYFDYEDDAGYSVVSLISNVVTPAAEGEKTAVEVDAEAVIKYFTDTLGYTYSATNNALTLEGTTILVEATAPVAATAEAEAVTAELVFTVIGNPPVSMDDGHVTKYSSTKYVADNGDAFLMGIADTAIRNIQAPYYDYYVKGKIEASTLPSLYNALPDASAYVNTTLYLDSDYSKYDGSLMYNYWLTTKLVDGTEGKEVLNAAKEAYVAALGTAGFVAASNEIWTTARDGYWCAASGQFVELIVDEEENTITVDLWFIGKEMRNYIKTAA